MHNHVHSTVSGATLTVFTKKKQQAGRCIFMVAQKFLRQIEESDTFAHVFDLVTDRDHFYKSVICSRF